MTLLKLWRAMRPIKKRFYKYGTLGLAVFDDRSMLEKICDTIDDALVNQQDRAKIRAAGKHIWHTYKDISTGKYISSSQDIKAIEKQTGLSYMSFKDIESEAKFHTTALEKKQKAKIRKDMAKIMYDVSQGRKFTKELHERIHKGEYEIGRKESFNAKK